VVLEIYAEMKKKSENDIVAYLMREDLQYQKAFKECHKLKDSNINDIVENFRRNIQKKGIIADPEELRTYLKQYQRGWLFSWSVDHKEDAPEKIFIKLRWANHPLIDYQSEIYATILQKFFMGELKHLFAKGMGDFVTFLKSLKDPSVLLTKEENKPIKERVVREAVQEIKDEFGKIDPDAVVTHFVTL
jgi:hypothetical protein